MGAAPRLALLSLALPADLAVDDFDALVDGFAALAAASSRARRRRQPHPIARSAVVDVTVAAP